MKGKVPENKSNFNMTHVWSQSTELKFLTLSNANKCGVRTGKENYMRRVYEPRLAESQSQSRRSLSVLKVLRVSQSDCRKACLAVEIPRLTGLLCNTCTISKSEKLAHLPLLPSPHTWWNSKEPYTASRTWGEKTAPFSFLFSPSCVMHLCKIDGGMLESDSMCHQHYRMSTR